ncbi:hypothetical protein [Lysobacter sp. A289]
MLPLAFGLLSLLVLQLIVVRGRASGRGVIGIFAIGLLVGVIAIGQWLAPPRFLPIASTSGLSAAVANDIRNGLDTPDLAGFVILDGGSYTARGVDDASLEKRLSKKIGAPIQVLTLALPGGNQLERWSVLQNGLALLNEGERDAFLASRKILLLEIHAQYDRYPLVQLTRNRHTDRAYAYLGPRVALEASRLDYGSMDSKATAQQWVDVAVHAAINAFDVGSATRVVEASTVEPGGGYDPLTKAARGFRYGGMKPVLKSLKKAPLDTHALPLANIERRRARIEALVAGGSMSTMYFSVPTPRVFDLQYARAFCKNFAGSVCVDHSHWGLLHRLDSKQFWYDNGHMQQRGAEIYTRWLARQLAPEMKMEVKGG